AVLAHRRRLVRHARRSQRCGDSGARRGGLLRGLQSRSAGRANRTSARTFNNLMQAPGLFYVVCLLMLITKRADVAQIELAWTFVVLRVAHAAVYVLVNLVPYRMALWNSSFVALIVLWFRFGALAT